MLKLNYNHFKFSSCVEFLQAIDSLLSVHDGREFLTVLKFLFENMKKKLEEKKSS